MHALSRRSVRQFRWSPSTSRSTVGVRTMGRVVVGVRVRAPTSETMGMGKRTCSPPPTPKTPPHKIVTREGRPVTPVTQSPLQCLPALTSEFGKVRQVHTFVSSQAKMEPCHMCSPSFSDRASLTYRKLNRTKLCIIG
jgi:hypothetical protein